MSAKPLTYHAAARYEHKAFIAKIRRELKRCPESCKDTLTSMLNWGLSRRKRFEARPGGLGRTKAKSVNQTEGWVNVIRTKAK